MDALNHYDDDLIFDVLKNTDSIREYLKGPFQDKEGWEIFSKQFEPKLQLNHALPERLKLLPVEEEVFYILHFAFYALELIDTNAWDKAIRDLAYRPFRYGTFRQESFRHGYFITGTFRHVHNSALQTFWQMDISTRQHFDMGTFRHEEFLAQEHFGTGTFRHMDISAQ